ncbi:hypothetical protein BGW39_011520 [Mortierella sp. 14UC]|nr:hypothetical protein BGW39_011520 [Mortierella sp. 14UC]
MINSELDTDFCLTRNKFIVWAGDSPELSQGDDQNPECKSEDGEGTLVLIGKAMATTAAVFPARLMTQHLMSHKDSALKADLHLDNVVQLSSKAKENLDWWIQQFRFWSVLS